MEFDDKDIHEMELNKEEEENETTLTDNTPVREKTEEGSSYIEFKERQRYLTTLETREEMVKVDHKFLKKEYEHAKVELKKIQSVPLILGTFVSIVDENSGIVICDHETLYVKIASTVDKEKLKPTCTVVLHKLSKNIVDLLPADCDSKVKLISLEERPDVTYSDIGGMDVQKREVREAVELPLTDFELYTQIGIDPPRGVLMYGPPGTGKTMLAKAVAHHTNAAFIRCSGTEFQQKYYGEGPRMVRDVFRLARENAPAIIFIDEVDAIATKRFDTSYGSDRETQRILIEMLNQLDGFDRTDNVQVIMATNRADTLDPALLRPGRLDRKIEFPLPDRRQKRMVFTTITNKMNIADDVDIEDFTARPDPISCADIHSICQAAGMLAIRENRYVVSAKDFNKAYKCTVKEVDELPEFYQ